MIDGSWGCSTRSAGPAGTTRSANTGTPGRVNDVDTVVAAAEPVVTARIRDNRTPSPWHTVRPADVALRTYGGPACVTAIGHRRGCGDNNIGNGHHRQC